MQYPIITYTLDKEQIAIDEQEVLRYLGYVKSRITEDDIALVRERIPVVKNIISGKACYSRFPICCHEDNRIELPYGIIESRDLSKNLNGCTQIYIFAATIGPMFDRLLQTTRLKSMADAAIFQAIGATAVEFVCDSLNDKIRQETREEGYFVKPRYSPGFGDYGLENQTGIFQILNPSKHVGITLKDNLIMAPEKSVTALIGVGKQL
ncbi:MAG: hypothetical protein ACI4DU_01925 [Lachnospiraceae bacterium]